MIEDDLRRRRVAGDIESQGAQRMPREVHVGELVVVAIIIGALAAWLFTH